MKFFIKYNLRFTSRITPCINFTKPHDFNGFILSHSLHNTEIIKIQSEIHTEGVVNIVSKKFNFFSGYLLFYRKLIY